MKTTWSPPRHQRWPGGTLPPGHPVFLPQFQPGGRGFVVERLTLIMSKAMAETAAFDGGDETKAFTGLTGTSAIAPTNPGHMGIRMVASTIALRP